MASSATTAVFAEPTTSQQAADKQAEFNQIKAQANKIDEQLDVIVEEYNEQNLALSRIERELQSRKARIAAAEKELAARQQMINERFASVYRQGSLSLVDAILNAKSLDQFLYYIELMERQSNHDAKVIAQVRAVKQDIETQSAELLEKERKQRELVTAIKAKKAEIEAQLKAKNELLAKVKDQLDALRKQEAKEQAELRKKLRAKITVSRGGGRSGVVSIALGLLGTPYAWGASGPNAFDCSGFTSYVYRQVGISLPHSSRAQYNSGDRISRDELQPGDLVFFAHGRVISHVGIYVGGGNFVHAPRTGESVKVQSIESHGGYVGACRP
ncbi:MAG: C40 family peptidase [Firmicutes bacterium]|nr:C40 family peptidase [Bacillota bacterium]